MEEWVDAHDQVWRVKVVDMSMAKPHFEATAMRLGRTEQIDVTSHKSERDVRYRLAFLIEHRYPPQQQTRGDDDE